MSCERDFFSKKGKIYRAQFKKNNDSFFFLEQTWSNISNTNYFQNELETVEKCKDEVCVGHCIKWIGVNWNLICTVLDFNVCTKFDENVKFTLTFDKYPEKSIYYNIYIYMYVLKRIEHEDIRCENCVVISVMNALFCDKSILLERVWEIEETG